MVLTKKQSSLRYPKIKIGFHPLNNVRYPQIWLVSSFNRKIHHFPMVGTRFSWLPPTWFRLVKVMVLAATNRPWDLDEALRRWGMMGWSETNLQPKKNGMDMMDFFCHQFKFAWIWIWIWYDMTNYDKFVADVPEGRILFWPQILEWWWSRFCKEFLGFVVFSSGLHKMMIHFLTGLAFFNASFWRQSILEMG